MIHAYNKLCSLLGELQVDAQDCREVQDFMNRSPGEIQTGVKSNGLRQLLGGGRASTIPIWPLISADQSVNKAFSGVGPLNVVELSKLRHSIRVAEFTKEFEQK